MEAPAADSDNMIGDEVVLLDSDDEAAEGDAVSAGGDSARAGGNTSAFIELSQNVHKKFYMFQERTQFSTAILTTMTWMFLQPCQSGAALV